MPHPEGYRKAMRVMELAERFGLPIVTFVDVPGAHPGPESEERGIAEAIARSIGLMSRLRTPIVAVITGEGGSGGALAIAVGDVVIALENAVYSVISPEGCASILWRTADEAPTAAARDADDRAPTSRRSASIDLVVPEPGEGAHTDPAETARRLQGDHPRAARRARARSRSTSSSRRATAATARWARTLRPTSRTAPRRRSDRASATASATCSTRAGGPIGASRAGRGRATSRRLARRSERVPAIAAAPPASRRTGARRSRANGRADHAAIDRLDRRARCRR